MKILNDQAYNEIWTWIEKELKFHPDCRDNSHDFPYIPPFQFSGNYAVYGIDNMTDEHGDSMDDLIHQALCNATLPGNRLFALDWQHEGFLYDPRTEAHDEIWVECTFIKNNGYYTSIPDFYPDGDYHFFIDEHLKFGYLGHPWRKEVWIFGDALLKEFEGIYKKLGWYKL